MCVLNTKIILIDSQLNLERDNILVVLIKLTFHLRYIIFFCGDIYIFKRELDLYQAYNHDSASIELVIYCVVVSLKASFALLFTKVPLRRVYILC